MTLSRIHFLILAEKNKHMKNYNSEFIEEMKSLLYRQINESFPEQKYGNNINTMLQYFNFIVLININK